MRLKFTGIRPFNQFFKEQIYRAGPLASFIWSMERPAAFFAPQRRGIGPVPTDIETGVATPAGQGFTSNAPSGRFRSPLAEHVNSFRLQD